MLATAHSRAAPACRHRLSRVGTPTRLRRTYLSSSQRDGHGQACALVALSADAARHNPALRRSFEAGIKAYLDVLDRTMPAASSAWRTER
jgi:hypothetical protein